MSVPERNDAAPARKKFNWLALLPLLLVLALFIGFLVPLMSGRDSSVIPSALIGRDAPATDLPPLPGLLRDGTQVAGLSNADFKGQLSLVNVWASWCAPCRQEHPLLMELARDKRIQVVGINYKDKPDDARRFLGDMGNPFALVGADVKGRNAIDWGVYGVPETYLVDGEGRIIYKHVGPFSPQSVKDDLIPAIEKASKPAG